MNNKNLKLVLLSNAAFSFISGSVTVLANNKMAQWFAIHQPTYFTLIGFGLVLFSIYVLSVSLTSEATSVKHIIWADWAWVVSSIILLISNPFNFSPVGTLILLAISIPVAAFAILQTRYSKYENQKLRFKNEK